MTRGARRGGRGPKGGGRKPMPARAAPKRKTPARRKAATSKRTAGRGRAIARPSKPRRAKAPETPQEVREAVLAAVRGEPGITDDTIARKLKITKARATAHCRALEKGGLVQRRRDESGVEGNFAIPTPEELLRRERARERRRSQTVATALTEGDVREAVADWLAVRGFDVEREPLSNPARPALDLLARRDGDTLACEALGGGKHLSLPRNAVPQSLGRLVERMGRGHAMYGLAFPDLPAFRASFAKVAPSVRRSLNLHAFFVRRSAGAYEVSALDPRGRPTNLL